MPLRRATTDPASRIERVIAGEEASFRRAFRLALDNIRDVGTLTALAELLQAGRFEEALAGLEAAAEVLGGQYGASLSTAATRAAAFLSRALTVTVGFDQTNVRAVDAIRSSRLRLIREFSAEQRRVTRAALADGIERGLNPIDQARNFRNTVGLTRRQFQTVQNFRALLTTARQDGLPSRQALNRALRDGRFDRSIIRALREGNPLRSDQVERMVERYQERLIINRSQTIARTEALRSVHQGTEEMYRQAIDLGQLTPQQLTRRWVTAGDERVRGSHSRLNGEERALEETWLADGGELRFPGDPAAPGSETIRCRCVISTRLEP